MATRLAKKAAELGLELNEKALEALSELQSSQASTLLEQVAGKGTAIRNPSAYITRTVEHGYVDDGDEGQEKPKGKGKGGGKRLGKSAARAEELGFDLDEVAIEALAHIPLTEALQLLEDMSAKGTGKGGGVRNPSGWVIAACQKINAPVAPLPLVAPRGIAGTVASSLGPKGAGRRLGKSAAIAEQRGLDLDENALNALANVPLRDALQLVEDVAAKGTGIRNQSGYVLTACSKMNGVAPWTEAAGAPLHHGKGPGTGPPSGRAPAVAVSGFGGKSAARAADLGIELSEPALDALSGFPLRDALDLLETIAAKGSGKGGIRNPSGYIITAAQNFMSRPQAPEVLDQRGRGKGQQALQAGPSQLADIDARVVELNRRGTLVEKIDVEALIRLKTLSPGQAHELLDAVEGKGAGKGIRNPSNYIAAAVARMVPDAPEVLMVPKKRPRDWQELPEGPARRSGGGSSALAARAKELGLQLDAQALEALAAQPQKQALYLLDQVCGNFEKIKNPSKYIAAACARGIETIGEAADAEDSRHGKRPRTSSVGASLPPLQMRR